MLWIFAVFLAIVALVISFLTLSNVYMKKRLGELKSHGIPSVEPRSWDNIMFMIGRRDMVQVEHDLYKDALKLNSPVAATPDLSTMIVDVNLLRNVLVKDFEHFSNRRPMETKSASQLFGRMLFSKTGDDWKKMRSQLSPTFTTGKIRKMFQLIQSSSERLCSYISSQNSSSNEFDFTKLFSKYSMDVIARLAFGIDSKSWEYPPHLLSQFERMGSKFGFKITFSFLIRYMIILYAPRLADLLGVELFDAESQDYFVGVVKQVMKHRRTSGEKTEDFLQLMLEVQQGLLQGDEESRQVFSGTSEGDTSEQYQQPLTKLSFEDDDIIANSLSFFMAGFDTAQTVLIFALYSLALEPEVQTRLYEEVIRIIAKHEGKLTYEALSEMTYLDMVIHETMRLYPAAVRTERHCTKDYTVPGAGITIKKGSLVIIPIHGIHQNPDFYPEPERFQPERFSPENKAARNPYTYLPFGHGPRNCIGMRFALVKVKTVIAQLVHSFQLSPCPRTSIPVKFDRSASVKPRGGMWLKVTRRN